MKFFSLFQSFLRLFSLLLRIEISFLNIVVRNALMENIGGNLVGMKSLKKDFNRQNILACRPKNLYRLFYKVLTFFVIEEVSQNNFEYILII